jgi:RNA polymerase sigma-70 factor, ECF subfamily
MTTIAHRRAVDRVRSVASEVAREERYALQRGEREIDQVWTAWSNDLMWRE